MLSSFSILATVPTIIWQRVGQAPDLPGTGTLNHTAENDRYIALINRLRYDLSH